MQLRHVACTAFAAALTALPFDAAFAQAAYPAKPVHLIVPFPAGGATDAAAREVADGLQRTLGGAFVVENRPGADGAIAGQAVMTAPADGYTLLFGSSSMEGIPFTQKSAPFATMNDLTPVSMVCRLVFGMVIYPGVPARTVQEFVTYAKHNPDRLNYASGSLSELMAAAQFMKASDIKLVKIGYKGGAQIVPDLASGRVQVSFGPLTPMLPFLREGKVTALAVLLDRNASVAPDVPTLKSAGITQVSGSGGLQAVFAPPRTPAEIVQKLNTAIRTVVSEPGVQAKFKARGQEPEFSTPEQLAALIGIERAAWERFVADQGIKPE